MKRQWVCREWQFSVISLNASSDALQLRQTLLYYIIYSVVVVFPPTPKIRALNGLERPFYVFFVLYLITYDDGDDETDMIYA